MIYLLNYNSTTIIVTAERYFSSHVHNTPDSTDKGFCWSVGCNI